MFVKSAVRQSSLWHSSHLVPGHGARVRYSLGTNANTPFLSRKHRVPVRTGTVFVSSGAVYCLVLAAKPVFQNGVRQGEME